MDRESEVDAVMESESVAVFEVVRDGVNEEDSDADVDSDSVATSDRLFVVDRLDDAEVDDEAVAECE